MKKIKLILKITALALAFVACGNNCGKTTYRPEVGVGYVFMYDAEGNVLHPVEGATIIVANRYWTPGMFGKSFTVTEEYYTTDAEGRYQVRFVEKGCFDKEMVYCNSYLFYYEEIAYTSSCIFGLNINDIKNTAIHNILFLDTIKLYK